MASDLEVNTAIKAVKPWVRFGVAPPGVAVTSDAVATKYGVTKSPAPTGYDWQYDGQYSEPVQWLKDQTIDYISPQVYWRIGHSTNDYSGLSAWWVKVSKQFGRQAFISQSYSAVNGASNSNEMRDEILANRTAATTNSTLTGSALFRMGQTNDAFVSQLTAAYTEQALPPAMTWYSAPDLAAPTGLTLNEKTLSWEHSTAERYSVYAYPKGANLSQALASSAYLLGISYTKSFDLSGVVNMSDKTIAVCALDRYGNEHTAALYNAATTPEVSGMSGADIYASELTMTHSGDTYTFSYRLNEDATDVTLQLLYEGHIVQTKSFGAQTKGVQSGTLSQSEITYPERNTADHLTWAIQATARPINALTKLSDDGTTYQFYRPFGVAVDNNPESEFFGRVYVTNTKNGTCGGGGRTTANGLYAFDAGLNALNSTAYTGGVSWYNSNSSGNSPFRVAVAPDGRVFLCDWSDAHSGIWIAPAGGITGTFTQLFTGLTRASSGLSTNSSSVPVHGSISGCYVLGTGEATQLFTMDEDYQVEGKTYNLLRYDIGSATSWSTAPSAVVFNNAANNSPLVNNIVKPVSDLHGGWWIIQHRYAETSQEPSLIHVLNGAVDYNTGGEQLLENSNNGGLAVNYDGSRIATTSQSQINVWDVTYDNDGHLTAITPAFEITSSDISGLGTSSNDVAFDPAGNIYYVSNTSERLVVIGLPKTNNSFTTPARNIYTIPLPAEAPTMDVVVTEWEQSGLTIDFRNTPTANGAVVKIGSLITSSLPLESVVAYTATGTAAANNVKHISLPDINLTDYAGHTMVIKWMNNETVIGQTQVLIPALISGENWAEITFDTSTAVVVLPNTFATLDLANYSGFLTIRSLEIYPGAKLVIKGGTLRLHDFILRAGWTTAHTAFQVPKMALNNDASLDFSNAYLDCVIDYAQYYPFAVPFPVSRTGITYRDYPSAPAAQGVLFRQYDGAQRATGATGDNWQSVTPTTLMPAVGYAITAKRPASVNYCIIRMPLDVTNEWLTNGEQAQVSAVPKNKVTVTAYGVGTGMWNNVGWNFIANPFMVAFNGNEDTDFAGSLSVQGDGSGIRYATIPTADFQDYYQVPLDEAALQPMSPFFVQAATNGEVTFLTAQRNPTLAPATHNQQLTPDIDLRLRLSGKSNYDQTYILLGEDYTNEPDLNADLPKEFGSAPKGPKIWSLYNNNNFASLALPNGQPGYHIPLAVQTTEEGVYTFALNDKSVLGEIEEVLLLDEGTAVFDLMNGAYSVTLEAGTITNRFALLCSFRSETPTDLTPSNRPTTNDSASDHPTTIKRLIDQRVIIIDGNGNAFDVLGNRVAE